MNRLELQSSVLETARAMNACGINRGSSGNVSARCADGFIVTPSGMAYDRCVPEDMVLVGLDGEARGLRKPSSEWRFHRDIYLARSEAGAIVHTHAPFATALACLEREIPPFHYMIARFGGSNVRCARYALFGSQALSDAIIEALDQRCGCLMSRHGMVVFGADLDAALALAVELETLCEQYWRALQIGAPALLDECQMAEVLQKFAGYGQQ